MTPAAMCGFKVLASPYVPKVTEANVRRVYTRSFIRRLFDGRTADIECDMEQVMFVMGDKIICRPEQVAILRGFS